MAFAFAQQCSGEGGSPEDGQLAVRMAIDILNQGYWFTSQAAPSGYGDALDMLASSVGPQRDVHGPLQLDTFDSAIRCLRSAEAGVDSTWIAAEYTPKVTAQRQRVVRGLARTQVEDVLGAMDSNPTTTTTPDAELVALEIRLDQLSASFMRAEDFFTMSNASVAQKIGAKIDWASLAGDRIIPDPSTGMPLQLTSGAQIADLILRMKSALRTASAASKGLPQPAEQSELGGLADAFGLVKNVTEGTIGLAGLCCEGVSWTLLGLSRVTSNPLTATNLAGQAETYLGFARSIASAPGISGALASIDVVRHSLTMLAPDTSGDDRMDATVGLATALANGGGAYAKHVAASKTVEAGTAALAQTAAGTLTAAAVAIPITWLVFKATVRGMGETTLNVTRWQMIDDFERLISIGNEAANQFQGVTTSLMMRDRELDPDMRRGFDQTANGFAGNVSEFLSNQRNPTGFGRGRTVQAQLATAIQHPGSSGQCRDPTVVQAAVAQLTRHITWCLENVDALVADEAGYRDAPTPTKRAEEYEVDPLGECEVTP